MTPENRFGKEWWLPSGHLVMAFPAKFRVIVLILACFDTLMCKLPLNIAVLRSLASSRSKPRKNNTGSVSDMPKLIPLPLARGFSSDGILVITLVALFIDALLALPVSTSDGLASAPAMGELIDGLGLARMVLPLVVL
jgi:hypothetical protein